MPRTRAPPRSSRRRDALPSPTAPVPPVGVASPPPAAPPANVASLHSRGRRLLPPAAPAPPAGTPAPPSGRPASELQGRTAGHSHSHSHSHSQSGPHPTVVLRSASLLLCSLTSSCSPAQRVPTPPSPTGHSWSPYFTGSNLPTRLGASSSLAPLPTSPALASLSSSATSLLPENRVSCARPRSAPPPRVEHHATRRGRARPPPDPSAACSAARRPALEAGATASGAEIRPNVNWGFSSLLI
ncbi:hypothetical protein U9M48_018111 [Paspalum notatum var. saurae]|uniref:Uncharacterized protein n=1 Tax=Paspalum notatum var. saurae TaxID=547442 RepID=A0AAQ3T9F3_PASNO